eukprot:408177-Prorocentrum_minimum.AAC.1
MDQSDTGIAGIFPRGTNQMQESQARLKRQPRCFGANPKTRETLEAGGPLMMQSDFEGTKERLQPRPWLIDDATAFAYKWNNHTYRKAIMFVVRKLGLHPAIKPLFSHLCHAPQGDARRPSAV